jgi:D-alanine transfer protein
MECASVDNTKPHLFAALIACGIAALILTGGRMVAIRLEQKSLPSVAPELFPQKHQGLAFQRAAAHANNVLPAYGSSELAVGPLPKTAANFFSAAPTGFQVSLIAKPGATSLTILQKIAALNGDLCGRKVAISLSPSWFLIPSVSSYWYAGNFSLFAASKLVFGSPIDLNLKRDIAARMLEFPETLTNPLLAFALERLASGRWLDRITFYAIWPLGKIQDAILDTQDHFGAMIHILRERKPAPVRRAEAVDWARLMAQSADSTLRVDSRKHTASNVNAQLQPGADLMFVSRIDSAREWRDLELLLRTLAKVHAQPLLISMPLYGPFYDRKGISHSAREHYYERIRAVAQRYHFLFVSFEEHDEDPTFLDHQTYHLTAKGWMYYNRALDEFFHRRVAQELADGVRKCSARK